VAALGDLTRFAPPKPLMSSLGLTPAAYAAGERRRQGRITKTGHSHARRALIEGAGASRDPANGSRHLQRRLEQRPKPLQDISWRAQVRRGQGDRQLIARGKHATQVVVAMARELVACMWAMAKQVAVPP
jgi:transposase